MKPETKALLEKAGKSLEAAEILYRDGFLDFAASRAYYSLFYIAQAFLIEDDLSYSSQAAVISAFGKYYAKTGKVNARFHRYLLDAQDIRNVGDYGIGSGVTAEQVSDILAWAKEFLEAAEGLLK